MIEQEALKLSDKDMMEKMTRIIEAVSEAHEVQTLDVEYPVIEVTEEPEEEEPGDQTLPDLAHSHKHTTLKNSIVTRWNSAYTMICSILDLIVPVNEALKQMHEREKMFSLGERDLMEEFRAFLKPLQECT